MKIDFEKITQVIKTDLDWNEYNQCALNEIEFDCSTKEFIENLISKYQIGIIENKINLFDNSKENDEFIKDLLKDFPETNNKLYYDIYSCIGNVYYSAEFINDIFKLKVCKNIETT